MSIGADYVFRTLFNPIQGLDEDISEFIREFEITGSIRFTEFSQLWKKHKFIYLIYGRQNQNGLYDVLGCIFHRLIDLIQSSNDRSDLARVCALYLLYSFHGKQPIRNHVRVRVCPNSWSGLLQLATEARDQGHLDVYYVFRQLCLSNAMHFCGTRQVLYPAVPLFNSPQLARSEIVPEDYDDTLNGSDSMRTGQLGMISSGGCPLSVYLRLLRPSNETNGAINDLEQAVECLGAAVNRYADSKQLLNATDQTPEDDKEKASDRNDAEADAPSDEKFLPGLNFITYPGSLQRIRESVAQLREHETQPRMPKRSRMNRDSTSFTPECSYPEGGNAVHLGTDSSVLNDSNVPEQRGGSSSDIPFVKPDRTLQTSTLEQLEIDGEVGANRRILKQPRTWSAELASQRKAVHAHGHHVDRRRPSQPKLSSTVVYGDGGINPPSNT